MTQQNITSRIDIRFAKISDVPLILQFIKELAEYENLLQEVVATEETLQETLFNEKKYAEVIFACEHDPVTKTSKEIGFALFFHNFSTFLGRPGIYIEDLYVTPEARGKGVGLTLLKYIAKLARERQCGRVEWWVLDWNDLAIQFYHKIGAIPMDEWTVFRLQGESLDKLSE